MSTISALIGILLFLLFSATTYYFLDQEIKTSLTSTASELTTNYFVLANDTIQYISDEQQITITDLLKSRDLSAVIFDNQGNRIGTFGLFRYIFDNQTSQATEIVNAISKVESNTKPQNSHVELNENTYEVYTLPLTRDGTTYGYLQLAKQYTLLKKLRSLTSTLFFFAVPPVILLVWFISRGILEKFLRPLETLVKLFSTFSVNSAPQKLKTKSNFSEMHTLVAACNTMIDRLGSGIERQKHFTAYASHELNTPLTRAVGHLDRALISKNENQKDKQIESGITELSYVSKLLKGLLLLLQPNSENQIHESTNIFSILDQIQKKFQKELQRKNIKLLIDCEKDITCSLYETHVYMLLQNLLSNAIKYTKDDGEIKVLVIEKNENITISVKDSGIGITKEQKKSIFKPFFRTSEVRLMPGIGIGLSLVKQIAQMYDLDLFLESTENVGTTISIDKIKSN